ncbi:MAG: argininosuccinate lyase [Chloroflexi bacterium]|nr:argininosuccinate lyase [Chloroflexota bacterium]
MTPPKNPKPRPKVTPASFLDSLPFDRRLWRQDIAGSVAWARMLARQGIVSDKEAELIVMGLAAIREELDYGPFNLTGEDIHMAIEARLAQKIGEVAGKLHTGRSRNDQVALDLRLYVKETIGEAQGAIKGLQEALLGLAERHQSTALPGYTHLQRAQPVLLAHHLLAYFEMLERDRERFADGLKRADVLPLGSGALAGVPYPIDRDFLARELGFSQISTNSMDAVSDRDFVVEFLAASAMAMAHLSRLAEDIILWSSTEFGFVELGADYATGSSIMPQKRNPDAAELVRGKAGRVFGHLVGLLATLKGLPLTYNKDLQEDKEALFDAADTLLACLEISAGLVATLKVKEEAMARATQGGYLLATELADYLVGKGVPFRQAHGIVARLVAYAQGQGKELGELSLEEYRRFSPHFGEDARQISVASALAARRSVGGTAPERVAAALAAARRRLEGSG